MTKISVSMISWNEEDSIPLAIESVKGFADEVVVLDNGSWDKTVKEAEAALTDLNIPGEVKVQKGLLMYESRYKVIELCSHPWILMQDANPVMNSEGPNSTETLKNLVNRNPNKKWMIRCGDINLCGDYYHVFNKKPCNVPHKLLFHNVGKILPASPPVSRDRPEFPDLKPITLNGMFGVNLSLVRPAWRVRYRMWQPDWIVDGNYGTIPEYVEAVKGLSLEDVKELSTEWYLKYCQHHCVPIKKAFPEGEEALPTVIRNNLDLLPFKVLYREDKIVGRLPDVPPR